MHFQGAAGYFCVGAAGKDASTVRQRSVSAGGDWPQVSARLVRQHEQALAAWVIPHDASIASAGRGLLEVKSRMCDTDTVVSD
jgi:hypothetical protein